MGQAYGTMIEGFVQVLSDIKIRLNMVENTTSQMNIHLIDNENKFLALHADIRELKMMIENIDLLEKGRSVYSKRNRVSHLNSSYG